MFGNISSKISWNSKNLVRSGSKRLDTVSRKESLIAIEQLDSVLFRIPELVDYRVRYDQGLKLEARLLTLAVEKQVREKTAALYPKEPVDVCAAEITLSERPMYLGKRGVDFGRTVR